MHRVRLVVVGAGVEARLGHGFGLRGPIHGDQRLGLEIQGWAGNAERDGGVRVLEGPRVFPLRQMDLGQGLVGGGGVLASGRGRRAQRCAEVCGGVVELFQPRLRRAAHPQALRVIRRMFEEGGDEFHCGGPVLVEEGLGGEVHGLVALAVRGHALPQLLARLVGSALTVQGADPGLGHLEALGAEPVEDLQGDVVQIGVAQQPGQQHACVPAVLCRGVGPGRGSVRGLVHPPQVEECARCQLVPLRAIGSESCGGLGPFEGAGCVPAVQQGGRQGQLEIVLEPGDVAACEARLQAGQRLVGPAELAQRCTAQPQGAGLVRASRQQRRGELVDDRPLALSEGLLQQPGRETRIVGALERGRDGSACLLGPTQAVQSADAHAREIEDGGCPWRRGLQ